MQIIIDIDDTLYKSIKNNGCIYEEENEEVALSIIGGVPLPKGHGDLIDRQELLKSTLCKTFGLRSVDIENAPTIIEADKVESEE